MSAHLITVLTGKRPSAACWTWATALELFRWNRAWNLPNSGLEARASSPVLLLFRQHSAIHQPLQREHPTNIRLGLCESTIYRANCHANADLFPRGVVREIRPQRMTNLMHDRPQQISFFRHFRRLPRAHHVTR